jgi:hypothetical protein
MATLFQIRRGSGSVSLTDGELYLHKGSGSLQVALGTTPITLARLNDVNSGSLYLSGDVSASNMFVSGNLTVSGNLFLGNTVGDNISVPGVFTTNLVPGTNGTLNLGTEGAKWNTIYANSVTASISGSINNINITALSASMDSRLDYLEGPFSTSVNTKFNDLATISGSLIQTASNHEQRLGQIELKSSSYDGRFVDLATISGSLIQTASLNTISITNINTFTASVTGTVNALAYFEGGNKVSSFDRSFIGNTTLGLGTPATSLVPERLMVDAGDSYNIATFQTSQQNTYAQLNIKNFGSGSSSSTDLILWNDVATESSSYFDIGINSSNYSEDEVGYAGDAYIYNANNDVYIGSVATGSHGHLHLFGGNNWKSSSITVYGDGTIGINIDKLNNSATTIPTTGYVMEISGNVVFDNNVDFEGNISASTISGLGDVSVFKTTMQASTASLNSFSSSTLDRLSNIESFSSSVETKLIEIGVVSGSLFASASTAKTTNDTQDGRLSNLESKSSSVDISVEKLNSYSSSLKTAFEFTGSNVTILGDLNVRGTQTIVDSTTIQIGDNILELNGTGATNGGIHIKDSTSINNETGSLIWDSTQDYWAAGTKGNESKILLKGGDNVFTSSLQLSEINQTTQSLNEFSASVTASLESIYQTTASLNLYTESVNNDLVNIHQSTASLNLFSASVTASLESIYQTTASLNESTASLNLFSASVTSSLVSIYQTTASLNVASASLQSFSSSALLRLSSLETETGSLEERATALATITGSLILTASNHEQRLGQIEIKSGSYDGRFTDLATITGSLISSASSFESRFATLATETASLETRAIEIGIVTASLISSASSFESRFTTLGNVTASLESRATELATVTGSLISSASSFESRFATVSTETGSLEGRFSTLGQVTASIHLFTSSLNTYTGATEIRLDDLEYTASISVGAGLAAEFTKLNQFTASTNTRLEGLELYSASYAQYFTYSGSQFHIDFNV